MSGRFESRARRIARIGATVALFALSGCIDNRPNALLDQLETVTAALSTDGPVVIGSLAAHCLEPVERLIGEVRTALDRRRNSLFGSSRKGRKPQNGSGV
ncbi:hypothetical protein QA600_06265 [Natronococcus sp. A-GB1]|uniref:hypothetical protein n=1 Tax=Natronococcus sp. A-GB1 TaxID=3037648 RepID=UPI00241EF1F5|nr:hypothetical protein [Natronococcus sp. A-GB1]MDG5758942.1 hypothetical protein [Natronococcus sp. A-GB1]